MQEVVVSRRAALDVQLLKMRPAEAFLESLPRRRRLTAEGAVPTDHHAPVVLDDCGQSDERVLMVESSVEPVAVPAFHGLGDIVSVSPQ